jgi:hypothetical protein
VCFQLRYGEGGGGGALLIFISVHSLTCAQAAKDKAEKLAKQVTAGDGSTTPGIELLPDSASATPVPLGRTGSGDHGGFSPPAQQQPQFSASGDSAQTAAGDHRVVFAQARSDDTLIFGGDRGIQTRSGFTQVV